MIPSKASAKNTIIGSTEPAYFSRGPLLERVRIDFIDLHDGYVHLQVINAKNGEQLDGETTISKQEFVLIPSNPNQRAQRAANICGWRQAK